MKIVGIAKYNYILIKCRFGAGSEFGREQREEARRKRYGINIKKYKIENQPWVLNVGGKTGKR